MKVLVPIEEMTVGEIETKAKEVEAAGETDHAKELRQFLAKYLMRDMNPMRLRKVIEMWSAGV